jgi:hypothetical protein
MRKAIVARVWLGGLAGIIAGAVAIGIGTILMLAYGGTFGGPTGKDFVPTQDAFFWWTVGVITAGAFVAAAGLIAQFVAWIGALVNTYAAPEKAWFVVLLVGGLIGFVSFPIAPFVVMIVYLLIGPDLAKAATAGAPPAAPPATLAPA